MRLVPGARWNLKTSGGRGVTYTTMLDELVETGYTGTELGDWGFMPTDADALVAELARRELAINGAFVPVALKDAATHKAGTETAVRTATLLAAAAQRTGQSNAPFIVLADDNGKDSIRTLNAGRVSPTMGLSDAEWTVFARGADQIAHAVRDRTGLRTVFHHHCAGFVETHDEIERLLALTDADVLGLVFDTGHYSFGAGRCDAVLSAMQDFADRIWYVHFKDCSAAVMAEGSANQWDYFDAIRHGVFCELGQGCVDFPAVVAWLKDHNYAGYATVEQDVLPGMGSPCESAARNREYLRTIGL